MINIRRFGNLTSTSASEVLVSSRAYAEQGAQAQRSMVSTSAIDSDALATGARVVRINYLNSAYELKFEDVVMNGILPVDTIATDIRFIESLEVIKGVAAAGALKLMTLAAGLGVEFAGIGVSTTQSFMCHHYVPAGKQCFVQNWGATVDDEASMKLTGQDMTTPQTTLVDRIIDLEKLFDGNPTPPTRINFQRGFDGGLALQEKTYVRVTVVPNQASSTTTRSWLNLYEV